VKRHVEKSFVAVGAIFTAILVLALGAFLFFYLRDRGFYCPVIQKKYCAQSKQTVERAKSDLQRAHELTNGAPVTSEQLIEFLPLGWKSLRCPGGGTYTIQPLGEPVVCSIPEHNP
jgi:hypothetical protein